MWQIWGKYPGQSWEKIDEFDTEDEAANNLVEYRLAFGREWLLEVRKGA